jgi:hypothetical protein
MGEAARKVERMYLTFEEASDMTGMSADALRKAVLRGRLVPDSPARPGGPKCHRFTRETLIAYMEGRARAR